MLVARLWDALYARKEMLQFGPLGDQVTLNTGADAVTFPCPLQEMPGKHGPGRAVYDGQTPPRFIVSVLYQLQQEDLLHYFTITPPVEVAETGQRRTALPNHPDTVVGPPVQFGSKKQFVDRFLPREVEVISELELAIRRLNPSEIRALGTHENCPKTIASIKWEFHALGRRLGVLQRLRQSLVEGRPFPAEAQEWIEYAEEAWSKASGNRGAYAAGRDRIVAELSDPEVLSVFQDVQAPAQEIWEDPRVVRLWTVAGRSLGLARYSLTVSAALGGGKKTSGPLHEASAYCAEVGIPGLPDSADNLISADGKLLPNARDLIIEWVDRILKEMLSC